MRVGIIALMHESNTFIQARTTLAHFEQDLLCDGEEVRRRMEGTHHEVGGFFAGLGKKGVEAVPVFAARALPHGPLTADCFETLVGRLIAALEKARPVDGLLVAPHGAMVCDAFPDGDGEWLSRLRAKVGPRMPIIGTLDLHANLSARIVNSCNALMAYHTNPHIDQRERGIEAAEMMTRTLAGSIQPIMAAGIPPFAINIERQATAENPCKWLYDEVAWTMTWYNGFITCSFVLGFPYADVAEMGSAIVVVTDKDPGLARRLAEAAMSSIWGRRDDFRGRLVAVEDAIERARKLPVPVCLLDMGDNVGGGSPADGTVLLHALAQAKVKSFTCLCDPTAYLQAQQASIGKRARLKVGGKTDRLHGEPFEAVFTVRGLYDGRFEETEVRHGGITSFDQGPTAVVETDHGITVMLTSRRMPPFSLRQLTSFGIDPAKLHVLVAKGVHAPVAAYAPVCKHLIRVNTPGVTTADMSQLEYHHRRKPMFPFEPETRWEPNDMVMGHIYPEPEA
jgi:microcystin degradation protein MlrC